MLEKSFKMLKKAAKRQFDWTSIDQVKAKVGEELQEVYEAENDVSSAKSAPEDKAFSVGSSNEKLDAAQLHLEEEIGDLLMAVVNYARWVCVDPEIALERANRKFKARFGCVEESMHIQNIPMDKNHLDDMLRFWNDAKKKSL